MKRKFAAHIEERFPQWKKQKLLVACSGGLDSVVLTHLLHTYGYQISLAHCNFSLRDTESDEDETFVKKLAEQLKTPFYTEKFDTALYATQQKVSTQVAARELRYQWFQELIGNYDYKAVLTAHHADDNLETFFINLSRGTGLKGLTGIPELNDTVARPLLPFTRKEILKYAKKKNYYWREDSSNSSTKYLRNKLRHDVIPSFKKTNDEIISNFKKTTRYLQQSQDLIDDYMALIYASVISEMPEGYAIDIAKLKELPHTEALLFQLLYPFGFSAWNDIFDLLEAQSGKQIFSKTHRLIKDRTQLLLTSGGKKEDHSESFTVALEKYEIESTKQITTPIRMSLMPTDKMGYTDVTTVYIDASIISFPLQLRKWEKGDVFQPFGMKGKKKLSKFFKDEKLSLTAKENTWLLCDAQHIIWVVGYRVSEVFKVTPTTQQILKLSTTHKE